VNGIHSNGATEHPAIITRVWGHDMVNLTVFPDDVPPTTRTSVKLVRTKAEALKASEVWSMVCYYADAPSAEQGGAA
jgi:hypothetical protein